jgi:hypothetical protein
VDLVNMHTFILYQIILHFKPYLQSAYCTPKYPRFVVMFIMLMLGALYPGRNANCELWASGYWVQAQAQWLARQYCSQVSSLIISNCLISSPANFYIHKCI